MNRSIRRAKQEHAGMVQFSQAYPHLIQKLKDRPTRLWYACQTLAQGWTRNTRILQIKNRAHARQGAVITNVTTTLPSIETIEAELSVDLATEDAS